MVIENNGTEERRDRLKHYLHTKINQQLQKYGKQRSPMQEEAVGRLVLALETPDLMESSLTTQQHQRKFKAAAFKNKKPPRPPTTTHTSSGTTNDDAAAFGGRRDVVFFGGDFCNSLNPEQYSTQWDLIFNTSTPTTTNTDFFILDQPCNNGGSTTGEDINNYSRDDIFKLSSVDEICSAFSQ